MGGSSEQDLRSCKNRCVATDGCRTAQFCTFGNMCQYNGMNCFIYKSQDFTNAQLRSPLYNDVFSSWTFSEKCNQVGSWGLGEASTGLEGPGLGGTWEYDLSDCKKRCVDTDHCRAIQYSLSGLYHNHCVLAGHNGCNCYIHDLVKSNNAVHAPPAPPQGFTFYKYDDTFEHFARRLQDSKANAVITV